ncbi:IclR family transcriptional regulator [Phytoactinopolyspora halophila]|uniref:IclR family transcriptional regulator n=1 Tax=Phytoactinopolyspora halophila TaxID=1981511 RepID=UPI00319E8B18
MQSAARTVEILLAIAQSERGLTTKEIGEQVNIGRQAVYHLLHTLTTTGMVTRVDDNRFVLGLRVGTLAQGFERQLAPSEHLAPLVRALSRQTEETAYAAGWRFGEITVLAVARGTNPVQAAETPQGHTGNAHARASGKLLLAFASRATRQAYLDTHPLAELTSTTITDPAELNRELDAVRAQGYAVDNEEFAPGLCCLAVPFDAGHSPFVLALSAPKDRFLQHFNRNLSIMQHLAEHRTYPALDT